MITRLVHEKEDEQINISKLVKKHRFDRVVEYGEADSRKQSHSHATVTRRKQ